MKEDSSRKGEEEKRRKGEKITFLDDSPSEDLPSETKKNSSSPLFLFSFSLLHLLITLPLAYFLNIWADEGSTLYTTENGLARAFQNVLTDEKQAPLYFLLLSVWREINHSVFFARSLSIVFSLLAIRFFYTLARKLFDEKAAVFITAFFALHPYLIWASLEIRVYSLIILLSVSLLNFFANGYLNISGSENKWTQKRPQTFFVVTAIIALYTNYYLGFLLVGCFLALLVLRKFDKARQFFLQMLFVGLTILPLIWAIKQQFADNTDGFQPARSLADGLRLLWNFFLSFTFPTELFTPEQQTWISFLRVWLVRAGIVAVVFLLVRPLYKIWQMNRASRENDGVIRFSFFDFDAKMPLFGAIAGTIGLFLLVAFFLLGANYVELRHAAVWFVPVILFVFTILKNVLPRRGWLVFAPVLACLFAYSIYMLYPNFVKRGDWARVGAFIEQHEKAEQPIIIFTAFDALALPYYYKGVNTILPDEKFFAFEPEGDAKSADAWRGQTYFIISKIPRAADEIWLLTNEKCEVQEPCAPLEKFVAANYTVIEEKQFYKEKVRLLRKK